MIRTLILVITLAISPILAEEKPAPIAVAEVDQLQWANLILDADARQARGEKLLSEAETLRGKAIAKIADIKKKLDCEDCDAQLSQEGKLQLVKRVKK